MTEPVTIAITDSSGTTWAVDVRPWTDDDGVSHYPPDELIHTSSCTVCSEAEAMPVP
jgi:hypothetical protein